MKDILKELAITFNRPTDAFHLDEARTSEEIYPSRPDLAKAAEFAPGWLVGLNIANREKNSILRTACDIFGASMPSDVDVELPNAT